MRMRSAVLLAPWLVVFAVTTSQPSLFPTALDVLRPPAPSARPAVGTATLAAATADTRDPTGPTPTTDAADMDAADMDAADMGAADAWLLAHDVPTAVVYTLDGASGTSHVEVHGDATVLSGAERFEVLSITKTMIAAVALQLVDEGVLTLDEPLPPIDGIPIELTEGETLRRLLAHASGLADYRLAPTYDREAVMSPLDAVRNGLFSRSPL